MTAIEFLAQSNSDVFSLHSRTLADGETMMMKMSEIAGKMEAYAVQKNADLFKKLEVARAALIDVKYWDEKLENEWGDPGERATDGLKNSKP